MDSSGMAETSQNGSGIEWHDFEEDPTLEPMCAEIPDRDPKFPARNSLGLNEETIRRFQHPSLTVAPSVGSLVERFQMENPRVEIVNLYTMKYEVERMLDYEKRGRGYNFLVRWKGWSEKWDSWQNEGSIRREASPALLLHISRFFLARLNGGKALEYLREYMLNDLVQNEAPDCLLLSKLTNIRLEVLSTRVLAPDSEGRQRMRKFIASRLQPRSHSLVALLIVRAFEGNLLEALVFMQRRLRALDDHEKWRHRIQKLEPKASIKIENLVDCETLPSDFVYVTDCDTPLDFSRIHPVTHCGCEASSCFESKCCGYHRDPATGKTHRNYGPTQLLTQEHASWYIFECNSKCKCDLRCENRVIQRGLQVPLTIFRTATAEWRVRTGAPLKKGTFVGEYVGELITAREATSRDSAYILRLKPLEFQDALYAIDATTRGNITRFFNRSSEPNVAISYVYVENQNLAAPRLAFFTKRDIAENEELSFDCNAEA